MAGKGCHRAVLGQGKFVTVLLGTINYGTEGLSQGCFGTGKVCDSAVLDGLLWQGRIVTGRFWDKGGFVAVFVLGLSSMAGKDCDMVVLKEFTVERKDCDSANFGRFIVAGKVLDKAVLRRFIVAGNACGRAILGPFIVAEEVCHKVVWDCL